MPSAAQRALATMRVSKKGLPVDEPYRSWSLDHRRRKMRNSRIYLHWLESDDKKAEIDALSERYGLTPGRILAIIEKMKVDGSMDVSLQARGEVIKRFRTAEVLEDYNAYRSEIENLVLELRALLKEDQVWLDVEESEEVGGKFGGKTVTKRVRIETEIKRLLAELAKSHPSEAQALSEYGTKKPEDENDTTKAARANAEFLAEYQRLQNKPQDGEPIETDAEVVE